MLAIGSHLFFDLNWNFRQSFIYEKSQSTSSESAIVQTLDSPSVTIKELVSNVTLDTRNNNDAWPTSGSLVSFSIWSCPIWFRLSGTI